MDLRAKLGISRVAYVGVFVSFYLLATVATIRFLVRSGNDAVVPALTGLSQRDAATLLSASNLRLAVQGELFSDGVPIGGVLAQTIAPNERVREGRSVGIVVSKGPRPRNVPRLVGLEAQAVSVVLGSSGLKLRKSLRSCSEAVPSGLVIAQDPKPGQSTAADQVDLLISNGTSVNRLS